MVTVRHGESGEPWENTEGNEVMGMRFTERKTSRSRFDPFLSIKFLI